MRVSITFREDPGADDSYVFTYEYDADPYSGPEFNEAIQEAIRVVKARLPPKVTKDIHA